MRTQYTLPRQTHPYPRRSRPTSPSAAPTITITLKPMKPTPTTTSLTLPPQPLSTTILDLKSAYSSHSGLETSKIKLLLHKRPAADLKTLRDVLPEGPPPQRLEFAVMVLGGAASPAGTPAAASPAVEILDPAAAAGGEGTAGEGEGEAMDVDGGAPLSEQAEAVAESKGGAGEGETAKVLASEEFWADLKGFLVQRLRNEGEGERLVGVFRSAAGK